MTCDLKHMGSRVEPCDDVFDDDDDNSKGSSVITYYSSMNC